MKNTAKIQEKDRRSRNALLAIGCLAAALIILYLISFTFGRFEVPIGKVVKILLSHIFPIQADWSEQMYSAVVNVRFPRITIAAAVGCCLSAAGATYQGVFQNPMASPDILGASNGAAFGAALSILIGAGAVGTSVSAFMFSIATVALVFVIAQKAPGSKVLNLILAGIMIGSLLSAGTSYMKLVADPTEQLPKITYWLMGSLNGSALKQLPILILMAAGLIPLLLLRWQINLLTLGDDEAKTLGVNTSRLRLALILFATLITASSVSVSGMIGWVGLVIPHLSRKLVGSNYRYLMPASMILGAAFLIAVDDVARNLIETELPIGILTAFVGAPFFIYLLFRKDRSLG